MPLAALFGICLLVCVLAARFEKVARAVGEAVEEGLAAGDKGGWVWRSSRGWLGEKARQALNRRLFKITVDARRAIEQVRHPPATCKVFHCSCWRFVWASRYATSFD